MTQFTLNDLTLKTIRDLNLYDSEATPSDADFNFVKQTIQSEFARMEGDGIIMWSTSVDSIHHSYMNALSTLMGACIGPTFGVMTAASAIGVKQAAENTIRRLQAPTKNPEVLTIERAARGTRIRDPILSQ